MRNFIRNLIQQFNGFYKTLTPTKRVSIVLVSLIVMTAFVISIMMVSSKRYENLFTNVPTEQLPLIVSKLKDKNIPFELRDGGKTVAIPPELLHSTQMLIMTEAPSTKFGQLGFEIFDKQNFGTTSYAQKINYQRAIQGELMRAINTLDVVRSSKVLLALPPKKTFLEEGGQPTASVVVDIQEGKNLTAEQVRGITHLVASSVEGLDPAKVTVVDQRGKVLSKNLSDPAAAASSDFLEHKQKTERSIEEKIESVLEKVVGTGKIIAKVDANVSNQQITAVEELVDADKAAVRSIQSSEETLAGNRTNPVGVPGARANLPGAADAGTVGFSQDVKKELKTTNYDVPKTIRNIKESPGAVTRLSVAVLVDGATTFKTRDDGTVEEVYTPRTAEELQKYESLVKSAIGFKAERGDSVSIENIKFEKEDFTEANRSLNQLERRKFIGYLAYWSVICLSLILFFFIVIRPFMRWITDSFQESIDDMLPKTIEELEQIQSSEGTLPGMTSALPMLEETLDPDKAESELLREKIMNLIDQNNKKASHALSLWLVRKD
ncbi:MAG TPA: flagellar basal-body MS-ring/collar protein FliF [Bdellovibrionales bacterium]|nr:flagellar basal-body MS-ring/collar protein FliF [Bdellovibrionales bacterium]